MEPLKALRALLDDHEQRYGRGDLWRAASEGMAEVERDAARLDWLELIGFSTVREALESAIHWGGESSGWIAECKVALAALAALEAGERDGPNPATLIAELQHAKSYLPPEGQKHVDSVLAAWEKKVPPAPPAAEAIATAFARDFFVRHDHTYSGIEIYEWLKKQVTEPAAPPAAECAARKALGKFAEFYQQMEIGPDYSYMRERISDWFGASDFKAASAALAAPCECQRLREELARFQAKIDWFTVHLTKVSAKHIEQLAAAKSEIARLTSDLMLAVAWRKKAISDRTDAQAELRQMVDALRQVLSCLPSRRDWLDPVAERMAKDSVAAYDAKYGEGKEPGAPKPSQDYSKCPNCHVTLYHSATDTHERRHKIREGCAADADAQGSRER